MAATMATSSGSLRVLPRRRTERSSSTFRSFDCSDSGKQAGLVEEDRAAVGRLEEPRLGLAGVGEGAALEAEQLGLEQRLGDGRAVDVHERAARPRAVPMDGVGQQSLAGAGLAEDEDGRQPAPRARGRAHQARGLRAHLGDRGAVAQQPAQVGHGLHRTRKAPSREDGAWRWPARGGSAIVLQRRRRHAATGVSDGRLRRDRGGSGQRGAGRRRLGARAGRPPGRRAGEGPARAARRQHAL